MLPFLNPRSPNSMLGLYHGILPKVVSALFTTLNWGGGGRGRQSLNWGEGETKFVLSMFNNFVILAGMVSRVLSKIVAFFYFLYAAVRETGCRNLHFCCFHNVCWQKESVRVKSGQRRQFSHLF